MAITVEQWARGETEESTNDKAALDWAIGADETKARLRHAPEPDEAAKHRRLQQQTGAPLDFVRKHTSDLERAQRLDTIDYGSLASENPRLYEALRDPSVGPVVADSTEPLTVWQRTLNTFKKDAEDVVINPMRRAGYRWVKQAGALKRRVGEHDQGAGEALRGDLKDEYDRLFAGIPPHMRDKVASSSMRARMVQEQYERLSDLEPRVQALVDEGTIQAEIASELQEFYGPDESMSGAKRFLGDAVEAVTGSVLPLMAFGLSGSVLGLGRGVGAVAGLGAMHASVYGEHYHDLREKGYTPDQASLHSHVYALTEVLPEVVPLGIALKGGRLGVEGAIKKVAETGAAEAVQESLTEILQIGYEQGVLDESDITLDEAIGRVLYAGALGAFIGGGMGTIGAAADVGVEREARRVFDEQIAEQRAPVEGRQAAAQARLDQLAEQTRRYEQGELELTKAELDAMAEQAREAEAEVAAAGEALAELDTRVERAAEASTQDELAQLATAELSVNAQRIASERLAAAEQVQQTLMGRLRHAREQQTLEQLVEVARDTPLLRRDRELFQGLTDGQERVYVPAASLREFFENPEQSAPMTLDEFLGTIPGAQEQLQEATVLGGDLVLPTNAVVATLATTDGLQPLMERMRLSPESISPAEYQDAIAELDTSVQQSSEREAVAVQATQLEQRLVSEMRTAGTSPQAARLYAGAFRAYYETQANRLQGSPEALAVLDRQMAGLTVQSSAQRDLRPGELEQGDALEQALDAARRPGAPALTPGEIDGQRQDGTHAGSISERNPTAVRRTEDPLEEFLQVGVEPTTRLERFGEMMSMVRRYVGFRTRRRNPEMVAEDFIQHVVRNLLFLHDKVDPAWRTRASHWYDGARAVTTRWAERYGIPDIGIAAALASLSPQRDWFTNVSLAERLLDIHTRFTRGNMRGYIPEQAQVDRAIGVYVHDMKRERPLTEEQKVALERKLRQILSVPYGDLTDPVDRAYWLRSYDETYNDRGYRVLTPEGEFIGDATGRVSWGSNADIAKAIMMLENPTREYVSANISNEHKVRNFFNNILAPNDPRGSITGDTHAVAAGLLRPLAGKSEEVKHNFGGMGIPTSGIFGVSGTYGLFAEAYRRAAAARGLLPRQMQSITWEAVRTLFPRAWKTEGNVAAVNAIWQRVEKGELTQEEAQLAVVELAGGIDEPAWHARPDSEVAGAQPDTSYLGELAGSDVPGRGAGGRGGSGAGGSRSYGQSVLAGELTLTHYTRHTGLTALDPARHGEGIRGEESRRKVDDAEHWVDRTYYGIDVGLPGGYVREPGLGPEAYEATLEGSRLYDMQRDPQGFAPRARELARTGGGHPANIEEQLIRDAGYAGYWVEHSGMGRVAAVFESLPVRYAGTAEARAKAAPPRLPQVQPAETTLDMFKPYMLRDILTRDGWAILTPENPNNTELSAEENARLVQQFEAELQARGIEYTPVLGKYGGPLEHSFLVLADLGTAMQLGNKYQQESVLTRHGLVYGDGTVTPATGVTRHQGDPGDFFSRIPAYGDAPFTVDLNFDVREPMDIPQAASVQKFPGIDTIVPGYEVYAGRVERVPRDIQAAFDRQRTGLGEPLSQERERALRVALQDLLRAGVPRSMVDAAAHWGQHSISGFYALVHPETRHVSVRGSDLDAGGPVLRTAILHELSHLVDMEGVASTSVARSAPQFQADGTIFIEAAFTTGEMREFLGYPLDRFEVTDPRMASELFAQLSVVHFTNPGLLAEQMPVAAQVMEQTYGRGGAVPEIRGRLQAALRVAADVVPDDARPGGADGVAQGLVAAWQGTEARPGAAGGSVLLDELGFFSQLRSVLAEKLPERAKVAAMKQAIEAFERKGQFKQEELQWSGLMGWLDQQEGRVTREQVLEFLDANRLEVSEVVTQDEPESDNRVLLPEQWDAIWDERVAEELQRWDFVEVTAENEAEWTDIPIGTWVALDPNGELLRTDYGDELTASSRDRIMEAVESILDNTLPQELADQYRSEGWLLPGDERPDTETVYDEYQAVPGGESYTEMLLTLPSLPGAEFSGPHWRDGNVVAHARTSDFTSEDGKHVLVVQEVQSDWHQAGRDRGYENPEAATAARDAYLAKREERMKVDEELEAARKEIARTDARDTERLQELRAELNASGAEVEELHTEELALRDVLRRLRQQVPEAPFKTTWQLLVMKRLLRRAVQSGYDAIAWPTGTQQSSIPGYNQRHVLSALAADISADGKSATLYKARWQPDGSTGVEAGDPVFRNKEGEPRAVPRSLLPAMVTNDEAILDALMTAEPGEQVALRAETKVQVADPGMVYAYDKSLPSEMKKYVKKWGGKVETSRLEVDKFPPTAESDDATSALKDRLNSLRHLERLPEFADEGMALFNGKPEDYAPDVIEKRRRKHQEKIVALRAEVEELRKKVKPEVHSVDITPAMRDSIPQGQPLFQGERRGSIEFRGEQSVVTLFEGRDLSTVLHEAGHFFLETSARIAAAPDAPAEVREDYQRTLQWLGSTGDITVAQHERFARAFEAYLREGRAPSSALRRMFATFKRWLVNIYRDALQLNVQLDDEVRGIFDRMLASEDEIDAVRNSPLLQTDENLMSLLTKSEREDYLRRREQQFTRAREKLLAKMLRQKAREKKSWWKEERERLRTDIEQQVNELPVYRAIHFMQTGEMLDRDVPDALVGVGRLQMNRLQVARLYGPEVIARLPRGTTTLRGGLHPDVMADHFGFDSGSFLVEAMTEAMPRKRYIEQLLDEEMVRRHGDILNDGTIEREAEEALENLDRSRTTLYELQVLARQAGKPTATRQFYEAQADSMLAGKTLGEVIDSRRYYIAEVRAARQVGRHLARKNYELAAAAKREQLLNHLLYRRSLEIRSEVDKALARFKRYVRPQTKKKVRMQEDYHEMVVSLLEQYNLGPAPSVRTLERVSMEALADWMKRKEADDAAMFVEPPELLASRKTQYREMTLDEFRQLADTVDNIAAQGRMLRRVVVEGQRRDLQEVAEELDQHIRANVDAKKPPLQTRGTWEDTKFRVANFLYSTLKARAILRVLDGDEAFGKAYRYIMRALDLAEVEKQRRSQEEGQRIAELMGKHYGTRRPNFNQSVYINEIGDSLRKDGILAVALNWGNPDNRAKLLEGRGWTEQQGLAVMQHLSAQDLAFVNAVWEYVDSFWPEVAALEKRTVGLTPAKVEAEPFTLTSSDGVEVQMRGGYYPLKYDERVSSRAPDEQAMALADVMKNSRFASAQTRRGHTEQRVQNVDMPVRLDLQVLYSHVNQVVTDLAMREATWSAYKVMQQKPVTGAINETLGVNAAQMLDLWVKDVAVGNAGAGGAFDGWLDGLRAGVSVSVMGFKLSTTLVQLTGFSHTIVRLGPIQTLVGLRTALGNGRIFTQLPRNIRAVYAKSEFMRQRSTTFHRDINDALRNMERKGEIRGAIARAGFYPIVKMQAVVDVVTWLGAYHKGLQLHPDSEQLAVEYADTQVIEAQGSGYMKDLSAIERGTTGQTLRLSAAIRLWTVFYSYFNTKLNLAWTRTKGTDFSKPAQVAALATDYLILFWLEAVLGEMLLGRAPDEDDEDETFGWWSAKLVAQNMMATLPGLKEISGGLSGFDAAPAGVRGLDSIARAIREVGTAVDASFDPDEEVNPARLAKALNSAGGIVFKYPAAQVNQVIRGMEQAADGKDTTLIDYLLYQEN